MLNIFTLKDVTDKVLSECFGSKEEFKYAQREAFETSLN